MEEKYYDKYAYSENFLHFNRRILGDATGEMWPFEQVKDGVVPNPVSSWYGSLVWFLNSSEDSWFCRGGNYTLGTRTGIFASYHASGHTSNSVGFRIALAL